MATLQDMHTRQLLNALRSYHYTSEYEESERVFVGKVIAKGGEVEAVYATISEIRAVLNTRPHVSSKQEGKLLRRLRAQTGMSEAELRKHPKYGTMLFNVQHPRRQVISPKQAPWYQMVYQSLFPTRFYVKKK